MASTSEVNIDTPDPVIVTSGLVTVESGLGVLVQSGLWTMGIALADVSGEWVESHILSGEVTLPSTQVVKVSGEAATVTRYLPSTGSGSPTVTSGDVGWLLVDEDGRVEAHISSGEVTLPSTQIVKISGETVEIVSGQTIQLPATQIVKISGEFVEIVSGQTVQLPATQVVKVSGEWVEAHILSGEVTLPSTQVVKTSGEAGYTPTDGFTAGMVIIGAISGGVALASGEVQSLAVNTPSNNSGDIYMGFTSYRPYSVYGFLLEPGAGVTVDIDDPSTTYFFAELSGDLVSYMGTI